jgi:hypothetical protein
VRGNVMLPYVRLFSGGTIERIRFQGCRVKAGYIANYSKTSRQIIELAGITEFAEQSPS